MPIEEVIQNYDQVSVIQMKKSSLSQSQSMNSPRSILGIANSIRQALRFTHPVLNFAIKYCIYLQDSLICWSSSSPRITYTALVITGAARKYQFLINSNDRVFAYTIDHKNSGSIPCIRKVHSVKLFILYNCVKFHVQVCISIFLFSITFSSTYLPTLKKKTRCLPNPCFQHELQCNQLKQIN